MIQDNFRGEWIEEFERELKDDYKPGMLLNWRLVRQFLGSNYNTWGKSHSFDVFKQHFLLKDLVKFVQENGIHEDNVHPKEKK